MPHECQYNTYTFHVMTITDEYLWLVVNDESYKNFLTITSHMIHCTEVLSIIKDMLTNRTLNPLSQ